MIAEKTGKTRIQPGGSTVAETKEASTTNKRLLPLDILRSAEEPTAAALKKLGFNTFEQFLQSVANQVKLPRLAIDSVELDPVMAQLISRQLAERHHIVPVFSSAEEVTIATYDPTRIDLFDWLAKELHRQVITVVASRMEIERAIARLYKIRGFDLVALEQPPENVSEVAALETTPMVDQIISRALELQASAIHVEAIARSTLVRYRVDGVLRNVGTLPSELHLAVVSRFKTMAQLDPTERQLPQDGRIKIRRPGHPDVHLRVSTLPAHLGEKICCQILDGSRAPPSLADLGFEGKQLELFKRLIHQSSGLLLVSGPKGSGKSTTLLGALNAIRSADLNLVTIEDPIEYSLPGICQVQINPERGLTFASALRSIVRQDPNVILIGEIRDLETGAMAVEAAMSGKLVMSSLHTPDAPSAIGRLVEMGIAPYLVASALVGVVAQRLLRTICEKCKEEYLPSDEELAAFGISKLNAGTTLARGKGCDACLKTGYKGRTAVREILQMNEPVRRAVAQGARVDEIWTEASKYGFGAMRFEGLKKLFAGVTTSQEVLRLSRV
jgi:type IV pilus assembly protein PilB